MKRQAGFEVAETNKLTVLCVSSNDEDAASLARILTESEWTAHTNSECSVIASRTVASASSVLRDLTIPIVFCESDMLPGTWREMLEQISLLPDPPFLIVTSRLADARLWAEALNLGTYDLLAKPFDTTEVIRIVNLAWQHWLERRGPHANWTNRRKEAGA
jgi:DNA-binding NtrC family response regulator